MGVEAIGRMKLRAVSKCSIDVLCLCWIIQRIDVQLHRFSQRRRRLRHTAQNRLAAEDDDLALAGDVDRCGKHMLEIGSPHSGNLFANASTLGLAEQSGEGGVLTQIAASRVVGADHPADLMHRLFEQPQPLLAIATIELPFLQPATYLARRLIDDRPTQAGRQDAVIGEAAQLRSAMRVAACVFELSPAPWANLAGS